MSCNNIQILNYNHSVVSLSSGNTLVITDNNRCNSITIPQPVTNILQINSPGPQGPAGPSGSQGPAGVIPNTSSFATTGSNTFIGNQNIAGSVIITGSLTVSGSSTFTNIGPAIFSGSVNITNGITGSLLGTASYALTASYAMNGGGGGNLSGGANNYIPLWSSSTTLTSSIIYQSSSVFQFNTPAVNINDLATWVGSTDIYLFPLTLPTDLGYSFISSTTSSITLNGDIESFAPLPWTWTSIELVDNSANYVAITDPYYNNVSSIVFYSQSFDGANYTVFYSSSTSPGTVLPNNVYTSVTTSAPKIYVSGDLEVSGSQRLIAPNITGSLFGTASWAQNATTANLATSASYAINTTSASYATNTGNATTASYITGSIFTGNNLARSSSYALIAADAQSIAIKSDGSNIYSVIPLAGTSSFGSIFLGDGVGINAPNATDSIFLGYQAGASATNANNSFFAVENAGTSASNANNSIFIGLESGYGATNAEYSTFLGNGTGFSASYASASFFAGASAGLFAINAANSNFIGYQAGRSATSASYSVLIGYQAGYNTSGGSLGIKSNNIIIGTNITLPDGSTNAINIGGIIFGTGSYRTIAGNPSSGSANGRIGINVVNPIYTLDVSGSGNYTNGLTVTGSVISTGGFTGSLQGTASWASNAVTASYISAANVSGSVVSASYALFALNAITSSYPFSVSGSSLYTTYGPLKTNFSTTESVYIGLGAGSNSTYAVGSNFIGFNAGVTSPYASYANFFGYQAGANATSASLSNFIGSSAGSAATNADRSNFIGYEAGLNANSASYSVLIGYQAGKNYLAGSIGRNNIIIGTGITLPAGTQDSINIGGILFATGAYYNTVLNEPYSGSAGGRIGINIVSPSTTLDVSGSGRFTNGLTITGSTISTGGFTGSLQGTASWATNFVSAPNYVLNSQTSSFLTTGSFGVTQTISGSLVINQNLTVLGTQSVQYITSSQLNISTNIITVNTNTPSVRFGGLAVADSGSSPMISGSLLFDSQNNQWIFVHQAISGSALTSSVLIMGPQTYGNVGNETNLTNNVIPKSINAEHIGDSNISDNGTTISINSNTQITGSLNVSGVITGSLAGTASWATNFVSASNYVLNSATSSMLAPYVLTSVTSSMLAPYVQNSQTSSFVQNNQTGSFATTGSNNFVGNQTITGSLSISGSGIQAPLQVWSGSTSLLYVSSSGRVGIGTSAPSFPLEVRASSANLCFKAINTLGTTVGSTPMYIESNDTWQTIFSMINSTTPREWQFGVGGSTNSSVGAGAFGIYDGTAGQYRMKIGTNGNVMINTLTDAGFKLDVNGSGRFTNGLTITGSLVASGSSHTIIGTLNATSSWAINALTASFALNAGTTVSTASLLVTASATSNIITFTKGDASTFTVTVATGSGGGGGAAFPYTGSAGISGSLAVVGPVTSSTLLISGSGTQRLIVIGSGSATPIMSIQGSSGELFSITDSLSGSLFSVSDISGLPILETFSDSTTLMGSYLAPALYTTVKVTSVVGVNTIYSVSTASYDGIFVDYTVRSGSNARAGQMMAIWSGSSVNFTETTTTDFGTTTGVTFGASISGGNMIVSGSTTTAGWTIKSIIRSI